MTLLVLLLISSLRHLLFHFPVFCFQAGDHFSSCRFVGTVPKTLDKSKLDFKLGYLNEVCYNALYFLSNFSTFSSEMSLDVTF